MNNQSPFVPQGSMLEQKNKNRARVKLAVFFILAIHGVGLMALLMQGCRKEEPVQQAAETNAPVPASFQASNPVVETLPPAATNPVPATVEPTVAPAVPAATPGAASEYVIAQGDNFWTIGKKFGVTAKAIADANAGVDPAKLKIGQKIQIPAPTAATTAPAATTAGGASNGEQIYVVKSGDNLLKVAAQFHTTVKAIRTANNLATDRITVGQKLKIPKATEPATATNTTPH